MNKTQDNEQTLRMINMLDEKIDDLAHASSQSFSALGTDMMKLAVQVITIYQLMVDSKLTDEEEFKTRFLKTAASMQQSQEDTTDKLEDIEV